MKYQYTTAANRHLTQSGSAQSGYTLIELMIAVAIIGILVAIAIPSYNQHIAKTQQGACMSEAKSYSNHIYYLLNDQDGNTVATAPTPSACLSITDAATPHSLSLLLQNRHPMLVSSAISLMARLVAYYLN